MNEQVPESGAGGRQKVRDVRWQPFAAATAVVLLAGTAVAAVMMLGGGGTSAGTPPAATTSGPPAARLPTPLGALLVRDGDTVAASGDVRAVPGKPVRLCAPRAVMAPGYAMPRSAMPRPAMPRSAPVQVPVAAYCDAGVTLVGMDLGKLRDRRDGAAGVTGRAWVQGTYRAGTITVTEQGPPRQPAAEPLPFPTRTPCDPPAGGWVRSSDLSGLDELQSFIGAHGDHYGEVVITYPDGPPTGPTDSPAYAATQVALVTTTIDPATAYRELRAVYPSNLCVAPATRNRASVVAVGQRLGAAIRRHRDQISSYGPDFYTGRFWIELDVLDEAWYGDLVRADAGAGILDVQPWIRPVR
jgi:hypothetical protein